MKGSDFSISFTNMYVFYIIKNENQNHKENLDIIYRKLRLSNLFQCN